MKALYHGGARGYTNKDLLPEGCRSTTDLDQATFEATKHPDGDELHGGTVYRVECYGDRLRVVRVITPNVSRNRDVEARI